MRMVIDCRGSNRRFQPAPAVSFAGPEVFAKAKVEGHAEVRGAELDVDNCIHRMRMPSELSACFCFPAARDEDAGISSACGRAVGAR